MLPQEDLIVDIAKERERYFGCSGKMLLPCAATVEALVREIPEDTLATTALLQSELASRRKVQVTCPVALRQALQDIASRASAGIPYWRVIKSNGELCSYFPGGREEQGAHLAREGFRIDGSGKALKVIDFKARLAQF